MENNHGEEMKIYKNQRGFAPLAGLLILAVLAIVGFAIFYVYNSNKDDSTQESAQSSSKESASKSTSQDQQSFEFPELNAKIKLTKELVGLTYQKDEFVQAGGDLQPYVVSTAKVDALVKGCDVANSTSQYYMSSIFKQDGDFAKEIDENPTDEVILLKQFDGFYVAQFKGDRSFSPCTDSNAVTSQNPEVIAQINQARDALVEAFKNAEPIQ